MAHDSPAFDSGPSSNILDFAAKSRDAALRAAQMGMQQYQFGVDTALKRQQMAISQQQFGANLGLEQQRLGQQREYQQGELGAKQRALEQAGGQFQQNMGLQQQQFGLSQQQFEQQKKQQEAALLETTRAHSIASRDRLIKIKEDSRNKRLDYLNKGMDTLAPDDIGARSLVLDKMGNLLDSSESELSDLSKDPFDTTPQGSTPRSAQGQPLQRNNAPIGQQTQENAPVDAGYEAMSEDSKAMAHSVASELAQKSPEEQRVALAKMPPQDRNAIFIASGGKVGMPEHHDAKEELESSLERMNGKTTEAKLNQFKAAYTQYTQAAGKTMPDLVKSTQAAIANIEAANAQFDSGVMPIDPATGIQMTRDKASRMRIAQSRQLGALQKTLKTQQESEAKLRHEQEVRYKPAYDKEVKDLQPFADRAMELAKNKFLDDPGDKASASMLVKEINDKAAEAEKARTALSYDEFKEQQRVIEDTQKAKWDMQEELKAKDPNTGEPTGYKPMPYLTPEKRIQVLEDKAADAQWKDHFHTIIENAPPNPGVSWEDSIRKNIAAKKVLSPESKEELFSSLPAGRMASNIQADAHELGDPIKEATYIDAQRAMYTPVLTDKMLKNPLVQEALLNEFTTHKGEGQMTTEDITRVGDMLREATSQGGSISASANGIGGSVSKRWDESNSHFKVLSQGTRDMLKHYSPATLWGELVKKRSEDLKGVNRDYLREQLGKTLATMDVLHQQPDAKAAQAAQPKDAYGNIVPINNGPMPTKKLSELVQQSWEEENRKAAAARVEAAPGSGLDTNGLPKADTRVYGLTPDNAAKVAFEWSDKGPIEQPDPTKGAPLVQTLTARAAQAMRMAADDVRLKLTIKDGLNAALQAHKDNPQYGIRAALMQPGEWVGWAEEHKGFAGADQAGTAVWESAHYPGRDLDLAPRNDTEKNLARVKTVAEIALAVLGVAEAAGAAPAAASDVTWLGPKGGPAPAVDVRDTAAFKKSNAGPQKLFDKFKEIEATTDQAINGNGKAGQRGAQTSGGIPEFEDLPGFNGPKEGPSNRVPKGQWWEGEAPNMKGAQDMHGRTHPGARAATSPKEGIQPIPPEQAAAELAQNANTRVGAKVPSQETIAGRDAATAAKGKDALNLFEDDPRFNDAAERNHFARGAKAMDDINWDEFKDVPDAARKPGQTLADANAAVDRGIFGDGKPAPVNQADQGTWIQQKAAPAAEPAPPASGGLSPAQRKFQGLDSPFEPAAQPVNTASPNAAQPVSDASVFDNTPGLSQESVTPFEQVAPQPQPQAVQGSSPALTPDQHNQLLMEQGRARQMPDVRQRPVGNGAAAQGRQPTGKTEMFNAEAKRAYDSEVRRAASPAEKRAAVLEQAKAEPTPKEKLEAAVSQASADLKKFPRQPNGLTPDEVKFSPEYRQAKKAYNDAFQKLREANAAEAKTPVKDAPHIEELYDKSIARMLPDSVPAQDIPQAIKEIKAIHAEGARIAKMDAGPAKVKAAIAYDEMKVQAIQDFKLDQKVLNRHNFDLKAEGPTRAKGKGGKQAPPKGSNGMKADSDR